MSKNITIQEGGYGKNLTVDKLKTDLSEGGTCLWVPEDAVGLTTKHISENGTYPATEDGVYGYSVVYVNVPGGPGGPASDTPGSVIIGTDPEDGEEYAYETVDDGEGGTEVKKTLMPSGIVITTPPTKLSYTDGETIDFSGIVVKLRKANGDFYTDANYPDSVIPFSELTFPVTTAHARGGDNTFSVDEEYYVYDSGTVLGTISDRTYEKREDGAAAAAIIINGPKNDFTGPFLASTKRESSLYDPSSGPRTVEYDGVTLYITDNYGFYLDPQYTANVPVIDAQNTMDAIDILRYMNFSVAGGGGGKQRVPVQWTPPASKFPAQKTRSTTFEITVTAGSGGTTVDDDGFSGHDGDF